LPVGQDPLMREFLLCLVLGVLSSLGWAEDSVWDARDQAVVRPEAHFDKEMTRRLLTPGPSLLSGTAVFDGDSDSPQFLPVGTTIYLFPYTEYCKQAVALYRKHNLPPQQKSLETLRSEAQYKALTGRDMPGPLPKVRVETDPEFALAYRTTEIVDERGSFAFQGIQPGEYYVQTSPITVSRPFSRSVTVGQREQTTVWSNGTVTQTSDPLTRTEHGDWYLVIDLEAEVTVPERGATGIKLRELDG